MSANHPRSAAKTRSAILQAARTRFAAEGFDRATVRAIARDASVDPALVIRHFGSKQALFIEATSIALDLPDLTAVPNGELAGVLLGHLFSVWEADPTFLGLLRASANSPEAATAMRDFFIEKVGPGIGVAVADHHRIRAVLVGAVFLGVSMGRYILENPTLAGMDRDALIAWMAPLVQQALTGPVPPGSGGSGATS